jgi:hypothetical protein
MRRRQPATSGGLTGPAGRSDSPGEDGPVFPSGIRGTAGSGFVALGCGVRGDVPPRYVCAAAAF